MIAVPRQPAAGVGVLTVDDQAVFRAAARDVIDATPGFRTVAEASCGADALALSDALSPDLVLLDVRMAPMSGIETARRLTRAHPEALVVLISLDEPPDVEPLARGCGAVAFIRKQDLSPRMLTDLWSAHGRH